MFRKPLLVLTAALALGGGLATQALAQSAPSPAQCEQALFIGPQQADPALMSACMPYFRTLATNAAAPGTFGSAAPAATVTLSTSGTGG